MTIFCICVSAHMRASCFRKLLLIPCVSTPLKVSTSANVPPTFTAARMSMHNLGVAECFARQSRRVMATESVALLGRAYATGLLPIFSLQDAQDRMSIIPVPPTLFPLTPSTPVCARVSVSVGCLCDTLQPHILLSRDHTPFYTTITNSSP